MKLFVRMSSSKTKGLGVESGVESELRSEHLLGEPNDLLKVVFVVNESSKEWSQSAQLTQQTELNRSLVDRVKAKFDDIGDEATEQCVRIARDYGFIAETPKGYKLSDRNELGLSHDWFCFDCDTLVDRKSRQFLKCRQCLRVFHKKCANFYQSVDDYYCLYCKRVDEWEKDGYIGRLRVAPKRVNTLIKFLLKFIKNKLKNKYKNFSLDLDSYKSLFVFKPMDLNIIEDKAQREEYQSISRFEDDFFVFMHNLNITSFDFKTIAESFLNLRQYLLKELEELRLCVDCYERSNDKELQESDKEWFCLPCNPPHDPVFVKVKGFSPWPSKVLQYYEDGKRMDVRFFDSKLRRMYVNRTNIIPFNDQTVRNSLDKIPKMTKWLKMFDKYLLLSAQTQGSDVEPMPGTSDQSLPKEKTNIDETIENVVQMAHRKRGRKKKCKTTDNSTLDSTSSSKPINVLNRALDSDTTESLLRVSTQPPPLMSIKEMDEQLKDKQRFVRMSAQIRNTQNEEIIVSECTSDETEVTEDDDCSPTQVQPIQIDPEISLTEEQSSFHSSLSEPFIPFRNCFEFTDSSKSIQLNSKLNYFNSSNCHNLSQTTSTSSSQPFQNQSQTSFKPITEEISLNSRLFRDKYEELIEYKESIIPTIELQEKIVLLNHYHNQQINALETELRQTRQQLDDSRHELEDSKTKNWCVVCLGLAQFHCCLRYYCSDECQAKDWSFGHYKQCLSLKTDK